MNSFRYGATPEKPAVVLDLGSAYLKCGFAGESSPRAIVPSPVRIPVHGASPRATRYRTTQNSHSPPRASPPQLGAHASRWRDGASQPMTRDGWLDVLSPLLQKIYFHILRTKPHERRVVVVEDFVANTLMRSTIAHVLFDLLNVPSVSFAPSPVLALSTTGAASGIVVDVGLAETRVLPIVHGAPVSRGFQTLAIGAASVRARMVTPAISTAMAEELLAQSARVSPTRPATAAAAAAADGGGTSAESALELLWELDSEERSVATCVLDALLLCSVDARCRAAQNIVLIGGLTMVAGMDARLHVELDALIAERPRYAPLRAIRPRLRLFAESELSGHGLFAANARAWVGGSLLGKLQALSQSPVSAISVSKKEYVVSGLPDPTSLAFGREEEEEEEEEVVVAEVEVDAKDAAAVAPAPLGDADAE